MFKIQPTQLTKQNKFSEIYFRFYSLGEDDESDSLQQSSGSKYAPSQLQQNNFGPRHTQSQLPKRPWIDA